MGSNDTAPIVLRVTANKLFYTGYFVLLLALIVLGFAVYYGKASGLIWATLMTLAVAGIIAHYQWFYYTVIDERELRHVRFFGLSRRVVPIGELRRVSSRLEKYGYVPNVGFVWAGGKLELNPLNYDERDLREALRRLRALGIPIDAELAEYLALDAQAPLV